MSSYRLDVPDAVVCVCQNENTWRWSFCWPDGSGIIGDFDWYPTEQGAKKEAKERYEFRTGNYIKRAKWNRQEADK